MRTRTFAFSEIRIFLQNLSPEQIKRFADGEITATSRVTDTLIQTEGTESATASNEDIEMPSTTNWRARSAASLTGVERLVYLLREVNGQKAPGSTSKVEGWQRIAVTPDIELSVRAGFDETLVPHSESWQICFGTCCNAPMPLSPNSEA